MDLENKLTMLKLSLGIMTTAYDERLRHILNAAADEIKQEGYELTGSLADDNLQIIYAEWLWRKRDTGEGMPRMIRWQLNNRLFDVGGETDG